MVTVLAILMMLVCFSFLLKQTFLSAKAVMLTAAVMFIFIAATWQFAIQQSQTRIAEWIASQSLMQDLAVILSVDVIMQLVFCFLALNTDAKRPNRRYRILRAILTFFPGIVIFPVLFAILVQIIFSMPGVSFSMIAYSYATFVAVIIPICTQLLRQLFDERELRLEILFLTNLLVAMTGIIATVNVAVIPPT